MVGYDLCCFICYVKLDSIFFFLLFVVFFFQAEYGIRDLVRSRGLGDVYKRQSVRVISLRRNYGQTAAMSAGIDASRGDILIPMDADPVSYTHLTLPTSDLV